MFLFSCYKESKLHSVGFGCPDDRIFLYDTCPTFLQDTVYFYEA